MSAAWEALQQGRFTEALALARGESAAAPDDINRRFFLAQLLVIAQEPEEALEALDVSELENPRDDAGLRYHQGLLRAEKVRLDWLARGEGQPAFAQPPPDWAAAFLEAHRLRLDGEPQAAAERIRSVHSSMVGAPGLVNDLPANDVRDCDDLLGPFVEALAPDLYLLIPFCQIQSLQLAPPESYPELLWRPADVVLSNGSRPPLRLPSLYVGAAVPDDAHRTGDASTFEVITPGLVRGLGQRHLLLTRPDSSTTRFPLRGLTSFVAGVAGEPG